MPERSHVGVVLLGLGTVGSGVARSILEKADSYTQRVGVPVVLKKVLVRDAGKPRQVTLDRSLITTNPEEALGTECDIVVEVMGGEQPAFDFMRQSLEAGRYVVTASKEVMAKRGPELLSLAAAQGTDILYEASVGGGIPIISPLKRDLSANDITSIRAIINGTTNYILTRMSREKMDFAEALKEAQDLGYAEPDPTNDIEGHDAAYKLAILASLAFHTRISPDSVYREGITKLTARDLSYADQLGYAIKLLAIARRVNGDAVQVRVHPALVPVEELLAKMDGVNNAVQVDGDLTGRVLFQGAGAGSLPTTSAVMADVLDAAREARPPRRRSERAASLLFLSYVLSCGIRTHNRRIRNACVGHAIRKHRFDFPISLVTGSRGNSCSLRSSCASHALRMKFFFTAFVDKFVIRRLKERPHRRRNVHPLLKRDAY